MSQNWSRLKSLPEILRYSSFTNDNLHRIAIAGLQDHERRTIRWWCKKYRTPIKPLEDHTIEELMVEMLEDYYDNNPAEIERFYESLGRESGLIDWDGRMPKEYEVGMKQRL